MFKQKYVYEEVQQKQTFNKLLFVSNFRYIEETLSHKKTFQTQFISVS